MAKGVGQTSTFSYLGLCITLFALIIVSSLIHGGVGLFIFDLLFSFFLLFSIYAIKRDKLFLTMSVLIAFPAVVFLWVSFFDDRFWIRILANGLVLTLVALTGFVLLRRVFFSRKVEKEFIFGALSVYLLIGFFWALLFSTIELFSPGSYLGLDKFVEAGEGFDFKVSFDLLLYYSFVTMTTLGYGDITPLSPLARNLSLIEAIMGQFYLSTLVVSLMNQLLRKARREEEQ